MFSWLSGWKFLTICLIEFRHQCSYIPHLRFMKKSPSSSLPTIFFISVFYSKWTCLSDLNFFRQIFAGIFREAYFEKIYYNIIIIITCEFSLTMRKERKKIVQIIKRCFISCWSYNKWKMILRFPKLNIVLYIHYFEVDGAAQKSANLQPST